MHEFSIVESLVQNVVEQAERNGIEQITALRLRRGSAFSEEALRQAYLMLSAGTMLENAQLEVETVNLDFECACGHQQVVTSDDLVGHMFVCPQCGAIKEIDESHDLELIEVIAESDS